MIEVDSYTYTWIQKLARDGRSSSKVNTANEAFSWRLVRWSGCLPYSTQRALGTEDDAGERYRAEEHFNVENQLSAYLLRRYAIVKVQVPHIPLVALFGVVHM